MDQPLQGKPGVSTSRDGKAIDALRQIIGKADVFVAEPGAGRGRAAWPWASGVAEGQHAPRHVLHLGYGNGGPAEKRKAYDLLIQAEAGFCR